MFHSLVQQQMPSNENTVCVTPVQVQNLVANNLCTNVSNSHLNPPTTYVMSSSARNVINFPFHGTAVGHLKSAISNNHTSCASSEKCNAIQSHTILKKSFYKKKLISFAKDNQKSLKIEIKKNLNNNLDVTKNRNSLSHKKEISDHEEVEKPRHSVDEKSESLKLLLTEELKKEES